MRETADPPRRLEELAAKARVGAEAGRVELYRNHALIVEIEARYVTASEP